MILESDKELINDYANEVEDLLASIKLQSLQTGEDTKVKYDDVISTYLKYRGIYGLSDTDKINDEHDSQLRSLLKNRGIVFKVYRGKEYIEKGG